MSPIIFPLAGLLSQPGLGMPSPVIGFLPLPASQLFISGITKDSLGVALPACTVSLFRTSDNLFIQSVVSDGSGNYSFPGVGCGETYYVVAYKAGSPDVAGTTINTLVGV